MRLWAALSSQAGEKTTVLRSIDWHGLRLRVPPDVAVVTSQSDDLPVFYLNAFGPFTTLTGDQQRSYWLALVADEHDPTPDLDRWLSQVQQMPPPTDPPEALRLGGRAARRFPLLRNGDYEGYRWFVVAPGRRYIISTVTLRNMEAQGRLQGIVDSMRFD